MYGVKHTQHMNNVALENYQSIIRALEHSSFFIKISCYKIDTIFEL